MFLLYKKSKVCDIQPHTSKELSLLTLHVPIESSIYMGYVSTKYTANNFSRRHFQVCLAGPSMGYSADADQMSPDVALHLGLHY